MACFRTALRRGRSTSRDARWGGYDATNVGLIGGAEPEHARRADRRRARRVQPPIHDRRANGKLRGEGLYLGAQGLYAPAGWDGWNVFGIGRLGVENWRMKRAVSFNGYNRENNKDWTGSRARSVRAAAMRPTGVQSRPGPSPRWTTRSRHARP